MCNILQFFGVALCPEKDIRHDPRGAIRRSKEDND